MLSKGAHACLDFISTSDHEKSSLEANFPGVKAAWAFEAGLDDEHVPYAKYEKLDESEVLEWARKTTPKENTATDKPWVKLLLVETEQDQKARYEAVKSERNPEPINKSLRSKCIEVASIFAVEHISWDRQLSGFQVSTTSSNCADEGNDKLSVSFRLCINTWHAIWRFDPTNQASKGIFALQLPGRSFDSLAKYFTRLILHTWELSNLPLFLTMAQFTINLEYLRNTIDETLDKVLGIELATGASSDSPRALLDSEALHNMSLGQRLLDATALCNKCLLSTRLVGIVRRDLQLLIDKNASLRSYAVEDGRQERSSLVLEETAASMYSLADALHLKSDRYCWLASIQQTALGILISQRNHETNMEEAGVMKGLALANKDDASSMKTLARVAIVFLPLAFIATLFQAPFWDPNGDSSENGHGITTAFKIYWAVAIPITLITMIVSCFLNSRYMPPLLRPNKKSVDERYIEMSTNSRV